MSSGRIFTRTLAISVCCLVVIFIGSYRVSAEVIEEPGQEQGSSLQELLPENVTGEIEFPENSQSESIPEESQPEENSTPVEENPELPPPEEPEVPVSESWQEAIVCLHYDFHVFLYGLIPLSTAILIVFMGCWWFHCTFIKSVL